MNFDQIASQILSAISLYSEILLCILAASVLGWIVGFMMQRARYKKYLNQHAEKWRSRYAALEESSISDAENLEEQLQSLAKETKSLQVTNRKLTDTLKKNDANIQKSRAETIELNRQHTETHERLQRIIQHKDLEIAELGNRLSMGSHASRNADASAKPTSKTQTSAKDLPLGIDSDFDTAQTVAIAPSHTFAEPMDATVQMTMAIPNQMVEQSQQNVKKDAGGDELDNTADLSNAGIEESTIVMDEEAIAFIRRSKKPG